jgi:hypothetical protein
MYSRFVYKTSSVLSLCYKLRGKKKQNNNNNSNRVLYVIFELSFFNSGAKVGRVDKSGKAEPLTAYRPSHETSSAE